MEIPSDICVIWPLTFLDCRSLREVLIPEGVELIGQSSFQGTSIKRIRIPSTVTAIQPGAFRCCRKLCEIEFAVDSQLRSIGGHAFERCDITEFRAPKRLEVLGEEAFAKCPKLQRVFLNDGLRAI